MLVPMSHIEEVNGQIESGIYVRIVSPRHSSQTHKPLFFSQGMMHNSRCAVVF